MQAHTEEQALAAHLRDDARVGVLQLREALLHQQARVGHALQKAILEDDVQHRVAAGRRQRIAAIGGAVGADNHALARLAGRHEGAERKTAADALGDRHDVGRDAVNLVREELAGTANAGLDLVHHQQQAMLIAQIAQPAQEARWRQPHAALALNGLDQNARRLRPDERLDRFQIAPRRLIKALHLRAEAVDILGVAARRDGGERAPVEGALEGNQMKLFGMTARRVILARGLDRAFQRLGAGVGEEHIVGEGLFNQPLRQPLGLRNLEQIRHMPELLRLFGQGVDEMRMAVPKTADRDARAKIEIARPVRRRQPCAVAALEGDRRAGVGRQKGGIGRRLRGSVVCHGFRLLNFRPGKSKRRPQGRHFDGRQV